MRGRRHAAACAGGRDTPKTVRSVEEQARVSKKRIQLEGCTITEGAAIPSTRSLPKNIFKAPTPRAASPHERRIVPHPLVHAPGGIGDSWRRVASGGRGGGQAQQAGGAVAKRVHLLGVFVNKIACGAGWVMQLLV